MFWHGTLVAVGCLDPVVGDGLLQDRGMGSRPVLQQDRQEVPQEKEPGQEERMNKTSCNQNVKLFMVLLLFNLNIFGSRPKQQCFNDLYKFITQFLLKKYEVLWQCKLVSVKINLNFLTRFVF